VPQGRDRLLLQAGEIAVYSAFDCGLRGRLVKQRLDGLSSQAVNEEHWRKLERLYLSAPTTRYYKPTIRIESGAATIALEIRADFFHAAGAVHGSVYFKLLDDAGFFAANSLVDDVLVLTAGFTIHLLRPVTTGTLIASGRLLHRTSRQFLAETRVCTAGEQLVGYGSGTYVKSRIRLTPDVGYE
jgi:uncharacterized protein (TIGR00369 family)